MSPTFSELLFFGGVALCLVAQLFIIRAVFRPGTPRFTETGERPMRAPSRPMEIAWAVLPGVALVFLFVWAWDLRA